MCCISSSIYTNEKIVDFDGKQMDPYDFPWLPEEVKHPKKAKNTDAKSLPFKGRLVCLADPPARES